MGGVPHEGAGRLVLGGVVGDHHLQARLAIPFHIPGFVAQVEAASVERGALALPLGQRQRAIVHLREQLLDRFACGQGRGEVQPLGREHPWRLLDPVHAVDALEGGVDVDHMLVPHHGHALRRPVGELEEAVTHPPTGFGRAGQGRVHQGHGQHQPQHGGHGGLGHGTGIARVHNEVELIDARQHQQDAGEALARALFAQPAGHDEADGDVDGGRAGLSPPHVVPHEGTVGQQQHHEQDLQVATRNMASGKQADALDHQDQAQGGHHRQPHHADDLPGDFGLTGGQVGQRVGRPDQVRQAQECGERLFAVVTPHQQQSQAGGHGDSDVNGKDVKHDRCSALPDRQAKGMRSPSCHTPARAASPDFH